MIRGDGHAIGDTSCQHLLDHGAFDTTLVLFHMQDQWHPVDQSIEDLLERRHGFTGKPIIKPSAGVQPSHLFQAQSLDGTIPIGRTIDGPVVYHHDVAIGRTSQVQLDGRGTGVDGRFEGGQRVFRGVGRIAPMSDVQEHLVAPPKTNTCPGTGLQNSARRRVRSRTSISFTLSPNGLACKAA